MGLGRLNSTTINFTPRWESLAEDSHDFDPIADLVESPEGGLHRG